MTKEPPYLAALQ